MKLYPKYLQSQLDGSVNIGSDTIKCLGVTSAYTQSDAHQFVSDLTGILGRSAALTTKTRTNGTFDCDDPTLTITVSGTIVAIIFYKDTGSDATSPIIAFDDKQNDGTTAISQAVTNGGSAVVGIHASGLFDL